MEREWAKLAIALPECGRYQPPRTVPSVRATRVRVTVARCHGSDRDELGGRAPNPRRRGTRSRAVRSTRRPRSRDGLETSSLGLSPLEQGNARAFRPIPARRERGSFDARTSARSPNPQTFPQGARLTNPERQGESRGAKRWRKELSDESKILIDRPASWDLKRRVDTSAKAPLACHQDCPLLESYSTSRRRRSA